MFSNFKRLFTFLFTAVFLLAIAAAYFAVQMNNMMQTPLGLDQPVSLHLKPGATIRSLARQLEQHDLLDDKRYFILWGRLHNQATRLQAGEYILHNGENLAGLLDRIVRGDVVNYSVTLVEGLNFAQVMDSLKHNPYLEHTLMGLSHAEIMNRLGYAGQHPEGRFFPDTYLVTAGTRDTDLLRRAYKAMQKVLAEEWAQREKDLPFKTPYEALILASIVEKETAVPAERPLIAGVFINRLRKNMRLQTDPTVIYGIKNYDGNIRFRDLRKDTPYNTYTRAGLTPTPIAMPGREAIHAVLHPDKTDKLYFVAYGDGSGRHVFSSNLKDHEKAVDRYQRKKK